MSTIDDIYNEANALHDIEKNKQEELKKRIDDSTKWETIQKESFDMPDVAQSSAARRPVLDYVTSAQGRIFINGILIDECYDLNYMYKESKEPIYGYLSKHYSTVLPGTVIIYGGFTINYKHDAYLAAILKKASENTTVNDQIAFIQNQDALNNQFKQNLLMYKAGQRELLKAKEDLKVLQGQLVQAQGEKYKSDEDLRLSKIDIKNKIKETEDQKEKFWDSLTPEYQKELTDKIAKFKELVNGSEDGTELGLAGVQDTTKISVQAAMDKVSSVQGLVDNENRAIADLNDAIKRLKSLLAITNAGTEQPKYAKIVDEIQKNEADLEEHNQVLTALLTKKASLEADLGSVKSSAQGALVSQNMQIQDHLDSDPNIAQAEQLELQLVKLNNALIALENVNQDEATTKYNNVKSSVDGQIACIKSIISDQNDAYKKLTELKAKMNEGTVQLDNAQNTFQGQKRAEDYHKFNIMIEYNGHIHKIIEDCELIGHAHTIMQGGEPIKEAYQFIAKDIK